jgi:hypothetical protein
MRVRMSDQPREDLRSIVASLAFTGVLVVLIIVGAVLLIAG